MRRTSTPFGRLTVEQLEDRTTPSAVFKPVFGLESIKNDGGQEWSSPNVLLVLWGDFWNGTNSLQSVAIQQSAQKVFDSGYLNMLTEYKSDGHANIGAIVNNQHVDVVWVPKAFTNNSFGHSTFGPGKEVFDVISSVFGSTTIPSNTLAAVVTPPGVDDSHAERGFNGLARLWVGMPDQGISTTAQMQDSFTQTFGHEVAEAISDPTDFDLTFFHSNGVTVKPGNLWVSGGGDQIGDNEPDGHQYAYREPNGALVQPLWSAANNAWVATDGNSQSVTLDPIWNIPNPLGFPTGSSAGASFSGQFDLTINGDQFGDPAKVGSYDDIIVLDTTANGGVLVRLNGEQFQFDKNQIRNVIVNPGLGHDGVTIRSVATNSPKPGIAAVTYTVNTRSWDGVVTAVDVMPQTQNLDGVVAPLTVHGAVDPAHPGQTILNLHDELHPGGIDYELKDGAGASSGVLTRATNDVNHFLRGTSIRFDHLTTLNIYAAGFYNDNFTIDDTPCATHLEGSTAGCTVDVQGTTLPLSYKGYSNSDLVHVGHGFYSPNPALDNYTLDTIHADVTVSEAFGNDTLDLTADDGGDTNPQNALLTDQGVSFGGSAVRIGGTQLRNFNVILGSAAGTKVDVVATPNTGPVGSTTTHLDSYATTFQVNVDGGIGTAQGVRGRLSIDQGIASVLSGRRADLLIDDSADTTARTVTLNRGSVVGLAPAAITFDEAHLNSFSVRGGKGGNRFTVLGTPDNGLGMPTALTAGAGTDVVLVDGTEGPLRVNGGGGVDFVTVGDIGTLQFVNGAVDLTDPKGQTLLTLDDHLDTVGRFGSLAPNSLTFGHNSYAAPISWANADVSYLRFLGGSGGNDFAVTGFVNRSFATYFESGSGNDKVQIFGGSGGSFYLDGNAGQDTVTVGSGLLTSVNGTVNISNSKGHTAVVADDSTAILDRLFRLTASTLNLPYPGSLTLTGTNTMVQFKSGQVDSFTLNAGSGFDQLAVLGLDPRVHLRVNGGAGKDTLVGPGGNHTWTISGANSGSIDGLLDFTSAENLTGQTGVDVFRFAPGGSISGTINGGGGGDWLDYSAVAQGVFVDLPTGKASLVNGGKAGGVTQIRNARGSDVGNVFTGDGQGDIFVGGAGSDLLVGGNGRNVLIGGGGTDVLRGGSAGDLLIAGTTSYDGDTTALTAIQTEWLSADTYAQRIVKLHAGVGPGGAVKLQFGVTVFADPVPNLLVGGAGQDWFFASQLDVILNKQAGDVVN